MVERNHWLWIWMGGPAKADPALIEGLPFPGRSGLALRRQLSARRSNYLLLVENLLDTTHLPFLHPSHARHRRLRALGVRGEARR
jgi:vanillate O-demethylase monooxygenase subunit